MRLTAGLPALYRPSLKQKTKSKKTHSKNNPKLMKNREVKAILKYVVEAFSYQLNPLRINSYSNCSFKG